MPYDDSTSVGEKIMDGLKEFTDALQSGRPIDTQMTSRHVELKLPEEAASPESVKEARQLLHISQPIFASFIGVSTKAVQKWERGEEKPNKMACRMLDEIRQSPQYWRERLAKYLAPKTSGV